MCVGVCFGGEEINVCLWGGGWYFKDIQKRQDPVSKHLFRLKSEWAALKRATELSQAFFVVFFFSSIPLSGRAPTSSLSPIWCYLCQQAGWFMVMEGRWWGGGGAMALPPTPPHHSPCDRRTAGKSRKQLLTEAPRKAASQKKALQNQN